MDWVSDLIEALTTALSDLTTGLATAITSTVSTLFVVYDDTGAIESPSVFAYIIMISGGIALASFILSKVFGLLRAR